MDKTEVRPGQVWADNDPRAKGRTIKVLSLVEERGQGGLCPLQGPARYARCIVLTDADEASLRTAGRIAWIKLSRFRPTSNGYRLVSDTPEQGGAQ